MPWLNYSSTLICLVYMGGDYADAMSWRSVLDAIKTKIHCTESIIDFYFLTGLFFSLLDSTDDYSDALVDHFVTLLPGCSRNVKRCVARPCQTDSALTCSDDKVVCKMITQRSVDCSGTIITVNFVTGCSCNCVATPIIINGLVVGSDTHDVLEGINVKSNGQTTIYTTDDKGQFTLSVPSSVRRLILKATDPKNNFIEAILATDIPEDNQDPLSVSITMVKKAPIVQINSSQPNELSISGAPSEQGSGVASINIPANAFFTPAGTPVTGNVSTSLTYLDPRDPDKLAMAPGRFVTVDSNGEENLLVTEGVFSLSVKDNTGNELNVNGEIDVYGKPGFALWAFDPFTATWMKVEVNPGRKRRQISQQQFLGSFNPQNVSWWNIDRVYSEPDCFFRVRVFQDSIAPANEIISGLRFQPYVSHFLASGTDVVQYYTFLRSSPCIRIKCPSAVAQATIRIRGIETVYGESGPHVSVLPANISEYTTDIRSVLQATPYFYSLLENHTDTLFINTPFNESGPFYPTEQTCLNASINNTAFWFTKSTTFVEGDLGDAFESRCATKIKIWVLYDYYYSNVSSVAVRNLTAVSSWGDNMYSISTGELNFLYNYSHWNVYDSCIEYRCSQSNETKNDTTRVDLGIENVTICIFDPNFRNPWFGGSFFNAPTLDPFNLTSGFFYSNTTSVKPAINDCLSSANYSGMLDCN